MRTYTDAPIGTITSDFLPDKTDWLLCDGSELDPIAYPELDAIIEPIYVRDDTVPDLHSYFINTFGERVDFNNMAYVALSPAGDYLLYGIDVSGTDSSSRLFSLPTWTEQAMPSELATDGKVFGADFSPDGSLCAIRATGDRLLIYDTSTWTLATPVITTGLGPVPTRNDTVRFSPDGQYVSTLGLDAPHLEVFDTATWNLISGTPDLNHSSTDSSTVNQLTQVWSPDSSILLVSKRGEPFVLEIDVATWTVTNSFAFETSENLFTTEWTLPAAFSPDGGRLFFREGTTGGVLYSLSYPDLTDVRDYRDTRSPDEVASVRTNPIVTEGGGYVIAGVDTSLYYPPASPVLACWETGNTGPAMHIVHDFFTALKSQYDFTADHDGNRYYAEHRSLQIDTGKIGTADALVSVAEIEGQQQILAAKKTKRLPIPVSSLVNEHGMYIRAKMTL